LILLGTVEQCVCDASKTPPFARGRVTFGMFVATQNAALPANAKNISDVRLRWHQRRTKAGKPIRTAVTDLSHGSSKENRNHPHRLGDGARLAKCVTESEALE
jgi:hypothetical protein